MMQSRSRPVHSSQTAPHAALARCVLRHARSPWRKPSQAVDGPALAALAEALRKHDGPLILDSFCGTGVSTAALAERHADALVIGVDKSAHRLARADAVPRNALLLRAHAEAVWRELAASGRQLSAHYILYPNPWPKPKHLGRRVHGHPAFPLLPRLGGWLELRSNWPVYVEEFGIALHLLGQPSRIATVAGDEPISTRFEQKYRASGQALWRSRTHFGSPWQPSPGMGPDTGQRAG
jgi:tRNA (guanine-N7-)-methyltransferase